jgi:hypothetical protein
MNQPPVLPFNSRAFVALLLAWCLLILGFTGSSMAWGPAGIADELLGRRVCLTRLLHLAFGGLMVLAATWHLFAYNWRPFRHYLESRASDGSRCGQELGASSLAAGGLALAVLLLWMTSAPGRPRAVETLTSPVLAGARTDGPRWNPEFLRSLSEPMAAGQSGQTGEQSGENRR